MHGGQVFVLARKNDVIKLFHVDGLEGAHELVKNGFKSERSGYFNYSLRMGGSK